MLVSLQYADPVADLLDKWGVFQARLFRESCVFHRGNYVKVGYSCDYISWYDVWKLFIVNIIMFVLFILEINSLWCHIPLFVVWSLGTHNF